MSRRQVLRLVPGLVVAVPLTAMAARAQDDEPLTLDLAPGEPVYVLDAAGNTNLVVVADANSNVTYTLADGTSPTGWSAFTVSSTSAGGQQPQQPAAPPPAPPGPPGEVWKGIIQIWNGVVVGITDLLPVQFSIALPNGSNLLVTIYIGSDGGVYVRWSWLDDDGLHSVTIGPNGAVVVTPKNPNGTLYPFPKRRANNQ